MGSYMTPRGVIGPLHPMELASGQRRAYSWQSPVLILRPCSGAGRVNIWAAAEHTGASMGRRRGGQAIVLSLPAAAAAAAVCLWEGGWVGAHWGPGRLVREIVPTKVAQCQVQAESSHSKHTTCYQFHASKCHRSNTALLPIQSDASL